jgi:hypothetical protein
VTDLFDTPVQPGPAEEPGDENQVLAEAPAEETPAEVTEEAGAEEAVPEEAGEETEGEDATTPDAAAGDQPADKKPEAPKQVNVVEEDPYEFEKCLITVAMALMPDDGSPDGRRVMLGVRNHQDEPIMTTCRLSDLMPLPDPIQKLLEQLKEELPARSEKATDRKAKAAEAKKKLASSVKSKSKPAPAPAKKAEKAKPTTMNLFDMFDEKKE